MATWNFGRSSSSSKVSTTAAAQKGEAPAKGSVPIGGQVTQEMIAKRAYELWEKKGRLTDQDGQNWQEAEAQLRAEQKGNR